MPSSPCKIGLHTLDPNGRKNVVSKVLIVDDDPHTVELIALYLRRDGCEVVTAGDGVEGLRLAREAQPDLLVLDLMLPRLSGVDVCRILRKESAVPIIMVTARVEEEDRLAGLDMGADDYVTKPFSPREVAARIRAVLRRTNLDRQESVLSTLVHGSLAVDQRLRSVRLGGVDVQLTPTEFRLLVYLMREPDRTFTRDQIIDRVFGYNFDGFDRTVDAHISSLRRKLKCGEAEVQYIHTVYGVGYRFGNG